MGLMVTLPVPPSPAGTLLGLTGFSIVTVNCGVTASTVTVRVTGAGAVPVDGVAEMVTV
jgi:hypothetical protein